MDFSQILISIAVVFISPIISVGINKKIKSIDGHYIFIYAIFVMLNLLSSKMIYQILCIFNYWENVIYTFQYMFISFVLSLLMPYFIILFKKVFKIGVEIDEND